MQPDRKKTLRTTESLGGPGWRFAYRGGAATGGRQASVDPFDRHSDRTTQRIPARRTPLPIRLSLHQTGTHRVQVDVMQLFLKLRPVKDLERIVFWLPKFV